MFRDSCAKFLWISSGRRITICQSGILWVHILSENGFPKNICCCLYVQSFLCTLTRLWINWLKHSAIIQKYELDVYLFWKEIWLHVCSMPSIWLKQEKKWISFLRSGILPFKANVIQENNDEASFHQGCLVFVHILYVCKNRVFYFRNYLVFIAILFEEMKSLC